MRDSAAQTIKAYLELAVDRMELQQIEETDLEKAREHLEKAEEEIDKELGNE
jgi:hypothetical protein